MRRRFIPFMMQLLLIQLTMESGLPLCSMSHSTHAHTAAEAIHRAAAQAHASHTGHQESAHPDSHGSARCDLSCSIADCGTQGHCVTGMTREEPAASSLREANVDVASGCVDAPRSRRAAPEPPPPRA